MRLVPCSPPAGIAHDALVDAPVTSIASTLLAGDASPAWHAYWDLSEESGPYYLCAEPLGAERATWYRIDVDDEVDARASVDASDGAAGDVRGASATATGSLCLVGRWRRGEAAPVLYAPATVQARVRAHGARVAGAARSAAAVSAALGAAAPSAAAGAAGDLLVGRGISDA